MNNPFDIYIGYFYSVNLAKQVFYEGRPDLSKNELDVLENYDDSHFAYYCDITALALGTKKPRILAEFKMFSSNVVIKIDNIVKSLRKELLAVQDNRRNDLVKDLYMKELRSVIEPFSDLDFMTKLDYKDKRPRETKAEQYLFNCLVLLEQFRIPFQEMCYEYDIDVESIQNSLKFNFMDVKGKYTIDKEFLERIYQHSNEEIFESLKVEDFFKMIETADFSKLNILVESKVKKLIFHLSKQMTSKWYKTIANSCGWKPKHCSGANVEANNAWMVKLLKIKPKTKEKQ